MAGMVNGSKDADMDDGVSVSNWFGGADGFSVGDAVSDGFNVVMGLLILLVQPITNEKTINNPSIVATNLLFIFPLPDITTYEYLMKRIFFGWTKYY
jgi:hypothetical protein